MEQIVSPLKAIRANCIECCCGDKTEVKLCEIENCPLHPFRLGHNPFRKQKEYTDEEKQMLAERMKSSRMKNRPD